MIIKMTLSSRLEDISQGRHAFKIILTDALAEVWMSKHITKD